MPFSPKFKIGTVPYSNLRQALQWIKDGIRPVESAYESALGIDDWRYYGSSPDGGYGKQKSELYLAVCGGAIPLFGRPGIGALTMGEPFDSFCFDRYGDRELVPISKLHEAGFEKLDFCRSSMGKITEWSEYGGPEKG